jgi:hypothetical protein
MSGIEMLAKAGYPTIGAVATKILVVGSQFP